MAFIVLQGNALHIPLRDESVQCAVTSPPYWGLRSYLDDGDPLKAQEIGQEKMHDCLGWATGTPCGECYVCHMVAVFREVKRVLRKDGVVWLNLGDSFASTPSGAIASSGLQGGQSGQVAFREATKHKAIPVGLKPKDLVGIPWRVALALQAPYQRPNVVRGAVGQSWLAALVDGEGCIGIRRHNSYSNSPKRPRCQDGFIPYLTIGNNDRELLDKCVSLTGYNNVYLKDRPKVDARGIVSRRDYYGWRLDGHKAIDVICDIYPYLVAKRKQAVLAYNLQLSNTRGRELRGNGRLPAAEQEKRETLIDLIRRCNQREPVDLPSWCEEPKRTVEPGWYLRSAIIWAKGLSFCDEYAGSTMPESVTDRPTKAHEYIFLLAKSKSYYYDHEAVKEVSIHTGEVVRNTGDAAKNAQMGQYGQTRTGFLGEVTVGNLRNLRDVWAINPANFKDAHFATFPPALVEPCIKAGTSEKGACPRCGAPWERVTEVVERHIGGGSPGVPEDVRGTFAERQGSSQSDREGLTQSTKTTIGWQPTCSCNAGDPVPCIVLDPFGGAGTTALVADRLGRHGVALELKRQYAGMAQERVFWDAPLLAMARG